MTARETIEGYLEAVRLGRAWDGWLADDVVFTSLVSPNKVIDGKPGVTQALRRFYGMVNDLAVNSVVADSDRAIALTRYRLQPPGDKPSFDSDVAESFVVNNGKITEFKICFDSAPYPR